MSTNTRYHNYVATAGQTVFDIEFEPYDETQLVVTVNDVALAPAAFTYSDADSTITLSDASQANDVIEIYSDLAGVRSGTVPANTGLRADDLNREFDERAAAEADLKRVQGENAAAAAANTTAIEGEIQRAQDAEVALGERIDIEADRITVEVAAREDAVNDLREDLTDDINDTRTALEQADATEAAARSAADTALSSRVDSADTDIAAEVLRNNTQDTTLSDHETRLAAAEDQIGGLTGAQVYKGAWDASSGVFPGGGAAQTGWTYRVSVAGTVDGEAFSTTDRISAITDNASTATFAGNWDKIDNTDAVGTVNGQTGDVVLDKTDIGLGNADNTSDADKPVSTAQQAALDAQKALLDEDIGTLGVSVAGKVLGRPGDTPDLFTTARDGGGAGLPKISDDAAFTALDVANMGRVVRVDNADKYIRNIAPIDIKEGRVYRAQFEYRRNLDPADPSANPVRTGVFWYDHTKTEISALQLSTQDLIITDGVQTVHTVDVPGPTFSLDVTGVDHVIPEEAYYAAAFVHTDGTDHRTLIGLVDLVDITEEWIERVAREAGFAAEAQKALPNFTLVDDIGRGVAFNFAQRIFSLRDGTTEKTEYLNNQLSYTRTGTAYVTGKDGLLTTVAANALRYTHDPISGDPLGILVEPEFTQILTTQPNQLSVWTTVRCTATADAATGIDGTASAYRLTDEDGESAAKLFRRVNIAVDTREYCWSITAKAETLTELRIFGQAGAGDNVDLNWDVAAGRVSNQSGPIVTTRITPQANGFSRLDVVFEPTVAENMSFNLYLRRYGTNVYDADGTGTILIDEIGLNPGRFPLARQVSITSIADQPTYSGDFPHDNSQGTILAVCRPSYDGNSANSILVSIFEAGGDLARIGALGSDGRLFGRLTIDATSTTITSRDSVNASGEMSVALSWDATHMSLWMNGICHGRKPHGGTPQDLDTIRIGHDNGREWGGTIARVEYLPKALDPTRVYDWSNLTFTPTVAAIGTAPNRQIVIETAQGALQLTNSGDNHSPEIDRQAGAIRWTYEGTDDSAAALRGQFTLPLTQCHNLDEFTLDGLEFHACAGQSRMVHVSAFPMIDTTTPDVTRTTMPGTGLKVVGGLLNNFDTLVDLPVASHLQPLKDAESGNTGQTPATQLATSRLSDLDLVNTKTGIFVCNTAIGSSTIDRYADGRAMMTNTSLMMGLYAWHCWRAGLTPRAGALHWAQGAADADDSAAVHEADIAAIYDRLNTQWEAIRDMDWPDGPVPEMLACCIQFPSETGTPGDITSAVESMAVQRAQLALSQDGTRRFRLAAPGYLFKSASDELADYSKGFADTGHPGPKSAFLAGHYLARMTREVLADDTANGLHAIGFTLSGTTVTIDFNTSAPNITTPLQFKTDYVAAIDKHGFTFWDDGVEISLSADPVIVGGGTQVELSLSSTPSGTTKLVGIGVKADAGAASIGPKAGAPRTTLCDSTDDDITIDGVVFGTENYCAIQYVTETV